MGNVCWKNIGDITVRLTVAAAVSCILLSSLPAAEHAAAAITQATDIPPEGLGIALETFARDRKLQLIYATNDVGNRHTEGAVGNLSTGDALKRLLKGTGLSYQFLDDQTVTVQPVIGSSRKSETEGDARNLGLESGARLGDLRLAQANQVVAQGSSTVGGDVRSTSGSSDNSPQLTEILVTAQKKTERLQDVPAPMTVLDPQTLSESGQYRLLDYFATVPGLNVEGNTFLPGTQYITIRGLSAGTNQNSVVATLIDDVPTGSGSSLTMGSLTAPDIDPSDLERIEVLKGPQGTLYGADSLGGLIKYVTKDPSTAAFSGRIEVDGVDVPDGGAGYAVRGAVNIPVSDALAFRISGFDRRDPGYTNDVLTGQNNINWANVYGGHVAALWNVSDEFSAKVSALVQETDGHGLPYFNAQQSPNGTVQPAQGYFNYTGEAFANPYTRQQQLYSATLKAKVAGVDLVSLTGYSVNKSHAWIDNGTLYDIYFPANLNVTGYAEKDNFETDKVTQEMRLSSLVGHWLDWLVGGFYTHENAPVDYQTTFNMTPATGAVGGLLETGVQGPFTLSEYSFFADATVHFTDRFNIQLGGRESWNRQTYESEFVGPAVFDFYHKPSPYVAPTVHANGNAFTYLVTPQFKISPDMMIYARVASGYRIGGPNLSAGAPGVPPDFTPDKTTNYEFGIKGDTLEHRLSFDASAYYITWHNFQVNVFENIFGFTTNAGDAKSEGLEAALQARPATGLTIAAQGSYNHAVLAQDLPAAAVAAGVYGLAGDRLPYSIPWSGGFTANQEFPLGSQWKGVVGGAVTYVGTRDGNFAGAYAAVRAQFPAYTKTDLHITARSESWMLNFYVNNVGDKRGIDGAQFASSVGLSGYYYGSVIRPRTVGLSVVRNF